MLELRLLELRLLELRFCVLRFSLELERFEPLLERDEPPRDDALRDVRGFAPEELALALLLEADPSEDLRLLFAPEPLDDLLLLCLLPDVLSFAATLIPLRSKTPVGQMLTHSNRC